MKKQAEEWLNAANDDLKVILKIPRIHNLIKLKEMTEKYIKFETDKISLEQVNEIYTDTRYPSDVGLVPTGRPSIELANKFYVFALRIKKEIAAKMETIGLQQELNNTE